MRGRSAQVEKGRRPIWFFTGKDNGIVQQLDHSNRTIATLKASGSRILFGCPIRYTIDLYSRSR
jgi:hypothetical protein